MNLPFIGAFGFEVNILVSLHVLKTLNSLRLRCHTFPFIPKTVWSQQQQIPLLKDTSVGDDEGRVASSLNPLFSV